MYVNVDVYASSIDDDDDRPDKVGGPFVSHALYGFCVCGLM